MKHNRFTVPNKSQSAKGGFTLVEVALATLAMGLGVLAVFSLLPSGLQMAEDDRGDTRCAQFAEVVMNGLRGNASGISDKATWNNSASFCTAVLAGLPVTTGGVQAVTFPANSDSYLRYTLNLSAGDPPSATLAVEDGRYGAFSPIVTVYTEFLYQGD